MTSNNSRKTSPRQIAANRENARKSTGPRTPRTPQSIRQQNFIRSLYDSQIALGERPDDFKSYLADMIDDWQPAGATEMTLVEDLATIEWDRRRIDRARHGLLVSRLEREEARRAKTGRESEDRMSSAVSKDEIVAGGLARSPDCPGKFQEMLVLVQDIIDAVGAGNFSESAENYFRQLWGERLTWRGAQIKSLYERFMKEYAEIHPDPPEESSAPVGPSGARPDAGSSSPPGQRGTTVPGVEEEQDHGLEPAAADAAPFLDDRGYAELRHLLLEEQNRIAADYREFRREHIEISRAQRDAMLAQRGSKAGIAMRERNSVDRHFERKMKLLMLLQKNRRERERTGSGESGVGSRDRARTRSSERPVANGEGTGLNPSLVTRHSALAQGAALIVVFLLGVAAARFSAPAQAGTAQECQISKVKSQRPKVEDSGSQSSKVKSQRLKVGDRRVRRLLTLNSELSTDLSTLNSQLSTVTRDVFWHIESHQVDENNDWAPKTKAKFLKSSVFSCQFSVVQAPQPWEPVPFQVTTDD